ncbi:hypothetical protein [Actinocorallia populi]|uniref:hypothetical protein n=1 Tax=Actinocorallia populi TaxID=2079200 RepID=UPI0013004EC8|nr:hypothetical protein [Actinocorallia populi]
MGGPISDTNDSRYVKPPLAATPSEHPKAVAKVVDDLDELLAFYDYPVEHWQLEEPA